MLPSDEVRALCGGAGPAAPEPLGSAVSSSRARNSVGDQLCSVHALHSEAVSEPTRAHQTGLVAEHDRLDPVAEMQLGQDFALPLRQIRQGGGWVRRPGRRAKSTVRPAYPSPSLSQYRGQDRGADLPDPTDRRRQRRRSGRVLTLRCPTRPWRCSPNPTSLTRYYRHSTTSKAELPCGARESGTCWRWLRQGTPTRR